MPFKSKAQQRYMFSEHPRIAERWADHTPDMRDLPERAKTAGYWDMMLKWAAVDPTIASHVKRVAKRMGYASPSDADIEGMFPKGWEKNSPSWQSQFEKSEWLKGQNTAKIHSKGVASGRARTSAGAGWTSTSKVPWVSRVARVPMRYSVPYNLGSVVPAFASSVVSKSMEKRLKHLGLSDKEWDEARSKSVERGGNLGGLAGGLLGLGIPLIANIPVIKGAKGLRNLYKRNPAGTKALLMSSLMMAPPTALYGAGIGGLIGSRSLPDKAREIAERRKAASEEEPAIPERYFTSRFAIPGLAAGAVSGAAEPVADVVRRRLDAYLKQHKRPPSWAGLFKNMPKGTLKNSLTGAVRGSAGGALSGYVTGRIVDHVIQKKLKESSQ